MRCPYCKRTFKVKGVGRPRVTDPPERKSRANLIVERIKGHDLTLSMGAKELGIGKSTMKRLVDGTHVSDK